LRQPTSAVAGAALNPAITVQLLDPFGNVDASNTSPLSLTLGANPGGAALGGTFSVAAVAGIATFTSVNVNKAGVGYTLQASGSGLAGVTSSSFNIAVGSAHHLVLQRAADSQHQRGTGAQPGPAGPRRRCARQLVTTDTSNVTIALAANPNGATLSGTLSVAAVGGIATFNNLSCEQGRRRLYSQRDRRRASAAPPPAASPSPPPRPASSPSASSRPVRRPAGRSSPAVTVRVLDSFGNLVTADTSTVTVALGTNAGGAALAGTVSATAVGGIATFAGLSINKAALGYTLTAIDPGLNGATSSTFDITPAAADHLTFGVQPRAPAPVTRSARP